jgi:NAD-dependent dihydropyrimidine dehydrogenase PreA subunit
MNGEKVMDRGRVEIAGDLCKGCGLCVIACPVQVLVMAEHLNSYGYHPALYVGRGCTGCGVCYYACPEPAAITVYVRDGAVARR